MKAAHKSSDDCYGHYIIVKATNSAQLDKVGLSRLTAAMGAQEMTSRAFTRHSQYLYKEMENCYKEHESVTKACVVKSYENEGKDRDDEILNIHCSFDATWLTRGHKSKIGAAFVMDMYSGMIIDFEVLSNFCRACAIMRKKKNPATFDDWYRSAHSGKCQANFHGLSGAMEPEGALRMWQRTGALSVQRMDKRKLMPRMIEKKKAKTKPDPQYQPGGF
ncbi:hypothetical protein E2C01_041802 [Portunus trituberculatus]|uniref:Mutator-like transposase domain-containing protein n=1 Tax=Portunus trituberculatus TaxID=210409 RepID=A0A5B7FRN3_PORTR|nr:hypothetical protein [Portunus trituberculatus]